jgi:hypothetical protein
MGERAAMKSNEQLIKNTEARPDLNEPVYRPAVEEQLDGEVQIGVSFETTKGIQIETEK